MAKIASRRIWNSVLLVIGSLVFLGQALIAVILWGTMHDAIIKVAGRSITDRQFAVQFIGMQEWIFALGAVGLTLLAFTLLGFAAREYGRLEGPTKPRWYEVVFLGPLLFAKALFHRPAVQEAAKQIECEQNR